MEIWKDVVGYEGLYQVSSSGQVKRVPRTMKNVNGRFSKVPGGLRKQKIQSNGYLTVNLSKDNKVKFHLTHKLVAEAFLGPRPEGADICHNDGDKKNNCVSNLRFDSHSENCNDRARHGVCHSASKSKCPRGHDLDLKGNNGSDPRSLAKGWRKCKACSRADAMRRRYPDLANHYQEVSDYYFDHLDKVVFYQEIVNHLKEGSSH